jgi:hypothetical protein
MSAVTVQILRLDIVLSAIPVTSAVLKVSDMTSTLEPLKPPFALLSMRALLSWQIPVNFVCTGAKIECMCVTT